MSKKSLSDLMAVIESAPTSAQAQAARDNIAARSLRVTFWNNVALLCLTVVVVLVSLLQAWMDLVEFESKNGRLPWNSAAVSSDESNRSITEPKDKP